MKYTLSKRLQRLETTCGTHASVYAIYLADVDCYQLVMGGRAERVPAALLWERYPTAQIVGNLGAAAMWDAI